MANTQMLQQQYGQYQEQLGQYGQEVNKFNMSTDVYNRQAKEYQALVDAYKALPQVQAYETAVTNYNTNLLPAYNKAYEAVKPQIEAYNQRVNTWNSGNISKDVYLLGRVSGSPKYVYDTLAQAAMYGNNAARLAREDIINRYNPGSAPAVPTAPTQPTLAADIAAKKPGEFTAKKPELTAEAPTDPGFTGQQMRQIQGQPTLAQREMSGEQEAGLVERVRSGAAKQKPDSIIGGLLQNVRYST